MLSLAQLSHRGKAILGIWHERDHCLVVKYQFFFALIAVRS